MDVAHGHCEAADACMLAWLSRIGLSIAKQRFHKEDTWFYITYEFCGGRQG
jgi:hypothetical protein